MMRKYFDTLFAIESIIFLFANVDLFVLVIKLIQPIFRLKPYDSDSDDEDYNVDFDESKLPPIEVPPGDHKLQSSYNLWCVSMLSDSALSSFYLTFSS